MTLQLQAYGLINQLSDESVYALIQVMMRMLPHERSKAEYEIVGNFDIPTGKDALMSRAAQEAPTCERPNRETAQAIRDGRAGIGLRSFTDTASMFAALDSEPDVSV